MNIINAARSEEPSEYTVRFQRKPILSKAIVDEQNRIIGAALDILDGRLRRIDVTESLSNPDAVKAFLRLKLQELEHEVFTVLFLDVKNRLIECDEMFRGSLTHTSVYPREVVKAALRHNAASVILAHNHPSGVTEPSEADLLLTRALQQALALVDVRTLDHIIVAGAHTHSFAEHGQI